MKSYTNTFLSKIRYCFLCGKKLQKKVGNLLVCSYCGFHHYINAKPCNAAILTNDRGEILLVKRKFEPQKGYWDFPGGFIDLDENAEESMVRELEEELNVKINNLKYFGSFSDKYYYGGIWFPTISFVFKGDVDNQKLKPKSDVQDLRFFNPKNIPYPELAFESVTKGIKKFLEK